MSEIIMQAFRGQSEHSDGTQCSEHSESIKRALREQSDFVTLSEHKIICLV